VRQLCKLEPLTMNVRLVYEVLDVAPGMEPAADPVLSVEVVQHRFRFAGERWEVLDEESE